MNLQLEKRPILLYCLGIATGVGLSIYYSDLILKKFVNKSEFIKKLIQK